MRGNRNGYCRQTDMSKTTGLRTGKKSYCGQAGNPLITNLDLIIFQSVYGVS